jgi:hypothetical protein
MLGWKQIVQLNPCNCARIYTIESEKKRNCNENASVANRTNDDTVSSNVDSEGALDAQRWHHYGLLISRW